MPHRVPAGSVDPTVTRSGWHISVLIPACNEQDLLPRCLASILRARSGLPDGVTAEIVVAVDRSWDGTARIAKTLLRGCGRVIQIDAGCVGVARAAAAAAALVEYRGDLCDCWLANTDADCVVPEDWLLDHLTLAEAGVEAVTGTVDVDHFDEHDAGVEQRFRESYVIHEDGTHPHVHGANFGVRADAYLRAGGWNDLTTAEDHDLWNRLGALGCLRVAKGRLKVTTSGRRVGRAPRGFAEALAAHNEAIA